MFENPTIAFPNAVSCVPNDSNEFSPVINDETADTISAAVNVSIKSASVLADVITLSSIVRAVVINGVTFDIKADNCVPRSANEDPPLINEAIPATKSAAVNAIIAPDRKPTPASTLLSTILIPVMNGVTFAIKADRFAPISGNPDDIPAPNPPTILPTNLPIAYPIVARVSPPEETNSLNPGILENAPNAVSTPVITATKPAKPMAP